MDDKQLAKLLERYLDGACAPEEVALIRNWYERHGEGDTFLNSLSEDKRQLLKEEMLNEVLYRIKSQKMAPKRLHRHLWVKISAAALALLVIKLVYTAYIAPTAFSTGAELVQKQISNPGKNILRQMLPDSSVVWLNPGSSVSFPEKFEAHAREILMDGECFFEITKNPERPFIIRSQHLVTKVWGTSFKITDHSNADIAKVSVATGKVSVSLRGGIADRAGAVMHKEEVLLNPTDEARFTKSVSKLYAGRKTDISELDRYKHLNLAFENKTLQNIAQVLDRNFNVKVSIENKELANRVMDADLTELNLPEVLEVLKTSMSLNYEIQGNQVFLKPAN